MVILQNRTLVFVKYILVAARLFSFSNIALAAGLLGTLTILCCYSEESVESCSGI